MPRYMDRHEHFPKPEGDQLAAMRAMVDGPADEFGVHAVNVIFGSDGSAHCLSDAPSADAVVRSHARLGVPLSAENVIEVSTLV